MGKPIKPKTKVVPIEIRLVEKRNKIYKCLCDMDVDFSDKVVLIHELIDSYIDLVRLQMAYKSLERDD